VVERKGFLTLLTLRLSMLETKIVFSVALVLVLFIAGLMFYAQPATALESNSQLIGYSTSAGNIAPSDINYERMNAVQRAYFTPIYGTETPIPISFEERGFEEQTQFNYFGQTPYFLLDGRLYPKEAFNGFNDNDKARVTAFYPVRR